MGKTFQAYLAPCHRTYSCIHCRAHLANHDELISKSFQGSQGRAYLFNSVVNVGCGPAEERVLLTGLHAVADIYCLCCRTTLGWKYEHAFESSQKYKEGKYIIELAHMIKDNGWDHELTTRDKNMNKDMFTSSAQKFQVKQTGKTAKWETITTSTITQATKPTNHNKTFHNNLCIKSEKMGGNNWMKWYVQCNVAIKRSRLFHFPLLHKKCVHVAIFFVSRSSFLIHYDIQKYWESWPMFLYEKKIWLAIV